MEYNESIEMYLEAVYILEKQHGHAHVVDIARHLGVSMPSVTKAMNQLEKQELIINETYKPINLTGKGRSISEELYNKHQLIIRFLEQSLGLSPDQAEINACRMEHIINDAMLEAIKKYINN